LKEADAWGYYDFICELFRDAVSSLGYIALNGGETSEMNSEGSGRGLI
jgi:hypothetical protein